LKRSTFIGSLVVPADWSPKSTDGGETYTASLVPDRLTVCGLLLALSLTVSIPVAVPVCVGENVTLIAQYFLLSSVDVQFDVEAANGPVVVYEMTVSVVAKLFVNVTFFAGLVAPTCVVPNVRPEGVNVACAVPVPKRAIVCGLPAALSLTLSVPVNVPSSEGVNVRSM
jgi:hypothetical protein